MELLTLSKDVTIAFKRIAGDENKPCLVFLHEGLGCIEMWKQFPERLCEETGCPGLIHDRAGYGKSSRMTKKWSIHYMHEYALNELPQILSMLIPEKPFFIIGHSDGGSIGLIFAAEKPKDLKGVITEAAHVFVEPETVAGIRETKEAYKQGKLEGLKKYHGDKTDSVFEAWSETWLSDWFLHWNIEYALPSVDCPVLAIQGADDQYGTAKQIDSIASKTSGYGEKILIDGCGHSPHHEKGEQVLACMKSFLINMM